MALVERLKEYVEFESGDMSGGPDLIEEAVNKIVEQEKKIEALESSLVVAHNLIDRYRKSTQKTTDFFNSI